GVVCVSHLATERVAARFGVPRARIAVVHNSVERARPRRDRSKVRVGTPPTVLFLGRVTRQKGPAHLLDAARRVVDERPDVRFVVAGDGDLLGDTVANGAADGLAEHVLYTGFLGPDGVRRMLARADLFVLPSVSEPFGIAPLEAADAGVPVVLSNQCGVAEVLTSALRFDYWDTAELARQILRGLESESLRSELIDGAYDDLERSTWKACGRELQAAWRRFS
ncbi:MAG: glycosyltransferase family 4 protein, partial [Planctomycetota bacterium]